MFNEKEKPVDDSVESKHGQREVVDGLHGGACERERVYVVSSSLVEGKESPAERELSCRDETKKTDRTIRVFPAIPSTIKNVASFRKNFNRHLVYLLFDLN